jgi:extracellular factor (EF) 3-hydroxypalmitic acid methyl ester biosynthesis protein
LKTEIVSSNAKSLRESFITCTNSQGALVRGTIMHLTGQSVVFEVYNLFSLLQMSEMLGSFEIHIEDRSIYSGRAVISSLVDTGIMLVGEATLVDPWQDLDILSILNDKSRLGHEVDHFLAKWKSENQLIPEFKVFITDIHSLLNDLSLWLEQVEVAVSDQETDIADQIRCEMVDEVARPIRSQVQEFFEQLEYLADNKIPPDLAALHKSHVRKELHPFTLCSPFVHRSYTKPLGYAGDYEMINMILDNQYQGKTIFAKTINALVLEVIPAVAHRNRIAILRRLLAEEADRLQVQNKPFKVLNIACGPAKEVREFILNSPAADFCEMTLLDFSPEALAFCKSEIQKVKEQVGCKIKLEFIEKSIDILLREAIGKGWADANLRNQYDFVYCAGLFDYLIDPVCKRLLTLFFTWLAPGGLLSVTNINTTNPQKHLMEYLLEWHVIHRNEIQLKGLNTNSGVTEVVTDDTGVNIFLNIRKV